jgi:hypothetical protein
LTKITWFAGWASDLSLWATELKSVVPQFKHEFVAFDEWFAQDRSWDVEVAILWSQGAHLLPSLVNSGVQNVLLLQPALDFCGAGGWPLTALKGMARQLDRNPEATLQHFAQLCGMEARDANLWVPRAKEMDLQLLKNGLGALATSVADLECVGTICRCTEDQVCVTPPIAEWAKRNAWPVVAIPGSHCPWHPTVLAFVKSWLEGLA